MSDTIQHAEIKPLRTAVAGVSGYAGGELVRLLLTHPRLSGTPPVLLGRAGHAEIPLTSLQPQLAGLPFAADLAVHPIDWQHLSRERIDLLFLATPHEQSREWVPQALDQGIRVIDLSGAWRLQNDDYRAVYNLTDVDPARAQIIQKEAVYGAPELHGPAIADARLVANPGCYATSIILALAPLLAANLIDLNHGIVCDSKSGVSGAGKALTPETHFMAAADNLSAYKVFGHRHIGELLEQLHLAPEQIQFTPHLLPIPHGILSTIYVRLNQPGSTEAIQRCLDTFYINSPLVRVRRSPQLPQIQHVVRTSFCDIGFQLAPDGVRLVLISCLDNLLKGAAAQAVQNMNRMAGYAETDGLF